METSEIELKVNKHYSELTTKIADGNIEGCCANNLEDESVPSFGCNTQLVADAQIMEGEIVIDLGSGPGHDTFGAALKVGPRGKVIGVDFSEEMITLARSTATRMNLNNVEFVKTRIDDIPIKDDYADVVISNCVVNLVEEKEKVFREAHRILKPGGRLILSDLITTGEFMEYDDELRCACLGGATSVEQYVKLMREAGFSGIESSKLYEKVYDYLDVKVPYSSVTFRGYK